MWGRSFIRTSLALALLLAGKQAHAEEQPLSIGAAMSLRNVMPSVCEAFRAGQGGALPHAGYDASGSLLKKIEAGAPIDVLVSADAATVDALIKRDHGEASSRRVVASNVLVLIGPRNAPSITFQTIDALPAAEMIAIGEPGAVPAGRYAKQAFERLGVWDKLNGRLVFGGDVGAVLNYARRGEVAAAVVYRTEIRGIEDVAVLDEAAGDWAPKAEVVAVAVKGSESAARGAAFVDFLVSPQAQQLFRDHGFGPP